MVKSPLPLLTCVLFLLFSCSQECINPDKLDTYTNEIRQWIRTKKPDTLISIDTSGFSQGIYLDQHFYHETDTIYWDNCNHSYGTIRYDAYYRTEITPYRFTVTGIGFDYNEPSGFRLSITASKDELIQIASYDIDQDSQLTENELCIVKDTTIGGRFFPQVLKASYKKFSNDINFKEVIYAKEFGILSYSLHDGSSFNSAIVEESNVKIPSW